MRKSYTFLKMFLGSLLVMTVAVVVVEAYLRDAIAASALGIVVVAGLLGMLGNWMLAAPINRAGRIARQIAAGDFSKALSAGGAGELADLAKAMNEMRDSLVGQIRITRAQQQNLQTVLASLREGIVAVAQDGTVALLNEAAADVLSVSLREAVGKRLEAVLPYQDILNLYQDALRYNGVAETPAAGGPMDGRVSEAGGPPARQVEMDKDGATRIIEVQAVAAGSEVSDIVGILVLRDVTELANAAAMKSQFVANASHELRTPLATIRAAVDALADVDPSDKDGEARCMGILDRNVARLEALTRDLLDLHVVESGKVPLRLEELRLADLADRVQAEFSTRAREKGIRLGVTARPADHTFSGDWSLLGLILRNLVDNAIKFTPSGGSVECGLEAAGRGAVIRVRDTGIGIRRQDQSRVFERFFQTDFARSGDPAMRGTGLGLAIVKHASERLGAKVELQSTLGKGTTITVSLPGPEIH